MINRKFLFSLALFLFCLRWKSTSANDREIGQSSLLLQKGRSSLRSRHRILKSKKKSKGGSKGKGGKGKSSKSPKKSKSKGKGKGKKSKVKKSKGGKGKKKSSKSPKKSKGGKGKKKSSKSPKKSKGKKGSKGGSKGKKKSSKKGSPTNINVSYYALDDDWSLPDFGGYYPGDMYDFASYDPYMTHDVSILDFDTTRDGEMGESGRSTNVGLFVKTIIQFPLGGIDDVWRLCLTADNGARAILISGEDDDDKYGPGGWMYLGKDEPSTTCTDIYYSGFLYEPDVCEPIWILYMESYNLEGEGKLSLTWKKNPTNDKPATTIVPSSAFIL